jgi:hypothetical protein
VTYNSYYNELCQGARVIELDEDDLWNYKTYMVTANELAQLEGSKLDEVGGRDDYDAYIVLGKIFDVVFNTFKSIVRIFA